MEICGDQIEFTTKRRKLTAELVEMLPGVPVDKLELLRDAAEGWAVEAAQEACDKVLRLVNQRQPRKGA
ncbi:MAG: hypothetical protein HY763_02205 [Planctomycetes bacterium]|nr:hypothetical protein [Planctomycetota bacterium]